MEGVIELKLMTAVPAPAGWKLTWCCESPELKTRVELTRLPTVALLLSASFAVIGVSPGRRVISPVKSSVVGSS